MDVPHKGETYYLYNPFEFTYNYTYVIPGDGGDYENPRYQCTEERCGDYFLQVQTSVYVNLVNEDAEFMLQATDTTRDGFHYNVYRMPLPFDNTKPMQLTLKFHGLDRDLLPEKHSWVGMIYPHVHDTGDAMYFNDISSHGFPIFDPTIGDGKIGQSWWYEDHYDDPAKQREIREEWLATYPDSPVGVIRTLPPIQDGPIDGVAPEYYEYLAAKLRENFPDGDYERILQESNIKQEWIDEFLDAMPSLELSLLEVLEGLEK